jgi:uncharacterized membrane protein
VGASQHSSAAFYARQRALDVRRPIDSANAEEDTFVEDSCKGEAPVSLHPVNVKLHDQRTTGQKAADEFTNAFGTWTYIIIQSVIIVIWMTINAIGIIYQWDEYPFILLNLAFSAQASYAAPLILMASNRSSQRDRLTLENDAVETDAILKIQDRQIELLEAIKAETALLRQLIARNQDAAPDPKAG